MQQPLQINGEKVLLKFNNQILIIYSSSSTVKSKI